MTNQEAIDTIKVALGQVEWDYPMDYAAAFDRSVEALEKQQPFEPVEIIDDFYPIGDPLRTVGWKCGKCGERIAWDDNYCPNCGNEVKWDD